MHSKHPVAKGVASALCRYVRFGYFVDGMDGFDAEAFRLAGSEASAMDPQSRICLEQAQASATSLRWLAFLLYTAYEPAHGLRQGNFHPNCLIAGGTALCGGAAGE